jgi:cellulose synthase/poly-beta-1,6-N-acetylglucosamine synthase-like glycosyltransferase
MWEVLFWLVFITLIYHYVGYPLVLLGLGLRRREPLQVASITPSVSLIISAYNEQEVIRQKLDNSLDLDYPPGQLEIIVASDGSTDRTPAIIQEYGGAVTLYHYPQRRGKNAALNETVPQAHGEILVFTDANGMYRKDALRKLVQHFAEARVGCVCGELLYRNPTGNPVAEGYNHYWRYDQWLKRLESRLHSLLGANGSIFAVRRELNEPLHLSTSNDMVLPIKIAARGYAVLYEPEAISVEAGSAGEREELRRRSRIVARGLLGVWEVLPDILQRGRLLLFVQLVSRKLLRYVFPLLLAVLLVSNAFLDGFFYRAILGVQLLPYALFPIGYALNRAGTRLRLLSLPYYFLVGNMAALLGMLKVVSLRQLAMWEGFDRKYDRREETID